MGRLCFPQVFVTRLFQRFFNFLIYITQCQETFQKDYCSTIPTYHGNSKERFYLKGTTKNSIKIIGISSLLNTGLGKSNDSSLILYDDRLSMYDTSYIFLKFTCPISKKTKTLSDKNKSFFTKPKIWLVQLKEIFRVSSVQ